MTVTTSYPGIYIQELPSLVHTITPAPTSVTVFVGYTNPFANPPPGGWNNGDGTYSNPIQLFSFADYQTYFGGFFSNPLLPDYVGQAVFQFFQNGGPTCYVVSLKAEDYLDNGSSTGTPVEAAALQVPATNGTITFTALQPVGSPAVPGTPSSPAVPAAGTLMTVTISNIQSSTPSSSNDVADIVITYGTTVETYRKVKVSNLASALQASILVSVAVSGPPTGYPASGVNKADVAYATPPVAGWTVIDFTKFGPIFQPDGPLDKVPIFNLLATPGITDNSVTSEAVSFCEYKRAFYIMDTPAPEMTNWGPNADIAWDVDSVIEEINTGALELSNDFPLSTNAALYYPWLRTTDPVTGAAATAPPSGFVAGMYGQEDNARGVWKSPAGIETTLRGTTGVDLKGVMTNNQQGVLNENALNCLRDFPAVGTVIFGARTTAGATLNTAQQQWRYVAVRRTALFIEQTLHQNLTWAVFEGNATPLWNALTQEVTAFMLSLFRQGAFAGDKPSNSFLVQCDSTTTTTDDINNGIVNILVGFAPLVPAEFVVVKIAQLAGQASS